MNSSRKTIESAASTTASQKASAACCRASEPSARSRAVTAALERVSRRPSPDVSAASAATAGAMRLAGLQDAAADARVEVAVADEQAGEQVEPGGGAEVAHGRAATVAHLDQTAPARAAGAPRARRGGRRRAPRRADARWAAGRRRRARRRRPRRAAGRRRPRGPGGGRRVSGPCAPRSPVTHQVVKWSDQYPDARTKRAREIPGPSFDASVLSARAGSGARRRRRAGRRTGDRRRRGPRAERRGPPRARRGGAPPRARPWSASGCCRRTRAARGAARSLSWPTFGDETPFSSASGSGVNTSSRCRAVSV